MKFKTFTDAVHWIESVKRFGDKYDLTRMEKACEVLGNPEKDLKIIHVGGTNGKGSTVTYLKSILLENGYTVGTYTSPYIVVFNERITYNNQYITDQEFLKYVNQIYDLHKEFQEVYDETITFFELITLISFLYFKDKDPDFVVYEVGLGGRLDATNVVDSLVSVLTNVGYDHMHVLGNTLTEIALNKLGIVKAHQTLITTEENEELIELFKDYVNKHKSTVTFVDMNQVTEFTLGDQTKFKVNHVEYTLNMIGYHQIKNAMLALTVIDHLVQKSLIEVTVERNQEALKKAFWPGRMEKIENIILDGAHNTQGMHSLKDAMKSIYKDKKIIALYTSMADKEYFDIIQILESFVDEIYFTEFDYPRCETALNLYNVSVINNKHMSVDAYDTLNKIKNEDSIILVTGSLYFVSYIRAYLKGSLQ